MDRVDMGDGKIVGVLDAPTTRQFVPFAYDEEFRRLLERAKGVSPRTRTALVKRMINAAKADRRVTQEEIDRIRKLAQAMDATAQAEREIANVWGR